MTNEIQYYRLPQFENIYLEDSFVTGIYELDGTLVFNLEVILTEPHPKYYKPLEGEMYCYKKAKLLFSNVTNTKWEQVRMLPSIDTNNEVDFGNIDKFVFNNSEYYLTGCWGEVTIECGAVDLFLLD